MSMGKICKAGQYTVCKRLLYWLHLVTVYSDIIGYMKLITKLYTLLSSLSLVTGCFILCYHLPHWLQGVVVRTISECQSASCTCRSK